MTDRGKRGLRSRPTVSPAVGNALLAALAAWAFGYGAYGVWRDDLDMPSVATLGRFHNWSQSHHFHGASAWVVAAGMACFGAGAAIYLIRRLKAAPGGKADRGLALPLCVAGVGVITAMQILNGLGFV